MSVRHSSSKERKRNKQPAAPAADERRHLWAVCGLCAAGFLVYANTLASSFHFDDLAVIVNNPAVRRFWDIPALFNAFNTRLIPGWTFAVNYGLGGLDVFGYHFFNIWLHVCNAVLLYTFVLQLLGLDERTKALEGLVKIRIAGVAAAVFLVHPIQTEAVDYIWQRTTLQAAFFYLGTIILYIYARINAARSYYRAALIACLGAMLSKEIGFTLPLMLLLLEWLFLRRAAQDRRSWFWTLPFLLMLAVIPILLVRTPDVSLKMMRPHDLWAGVGAEVVTQKAYWLTQVNATATYLRLFVWPAGLNIDHDYPLVPDSGWGGWFLSLALLLLIVGIGICFWQRRPLISLCVFWFLVTLSVESVVTSADILVEHRMYLPMAGLSLAAGLVFQRIFRGKLAFVAIIVAILSVATVARNTVWKNDLSLWSDAIRKSPDKPRAYNNRGIEFKKMGYFDAALQDFSRAIDLDPKYPEAYYNRGGIYKMAGQLDVAEQDYAKVIELEPQNFQGFDARGYIYRRKGMFDEALHDFATSIALNPRNPEVFNNRAYIYQKEGRPDLAIADYTNAINADPTYIYAYNNRGNLYLEKGKFELALGDYTRAISLKSDFAEAYVNRAVANFHLGRLAESWEDVRRAQSLGKTPNPEFLRQLENAGRQ
jgi:tetratricopeptide (TPR) repeat protein